MLSVYYELSAVNQFSTINNVFDIFFELAASTHCNPMHVLIQYKSFRNFQLDYYNAHQEGLYYRDTTNILRIRMRFQKKAFEFKLFFRGIFLLERVTQKLWI